MKLFIRVLLLLAIIAAVYIYTSHNEEISKIDAPQTLTEKEQIDLSKGPSTIAASVSQASKEFIISDVENNGDNYKIIIESKADTNAIIYYSIFRKQRPSDNFELALARDVTSLNWSKYPPIDYAEAKKLIIQSKKFELLNSTEQLNLMHFRGSQPFYIFGISPNKNIFGVNAENGDIVTFDTSLPTMKDLERIEIEESKKFLKKFNFMKNGLLEINRDTWSTLSEQEKKDMERATEETNKLINDGKLKLDSDFNIIFDKR